MQKITKIIILISNKIYIILGSNEEHTLLSQMLPDLTIFEKNIKNHAQ